MAGTRMESEQMHGARQGSPLDALRALIVVGLIFFHSALVFDTRDDYYVKNPRTTDLSLVAAVGVVWAMPLLFLVAGTAAWHSLQRRGTAGFARERLRRLLVPLVFATFTIIPLPQWLRLRAADPGYHETYPRFLQQFFQVHLDVTEFPFVVRGQYFETGHLWFIVLLLVFSYLLLPLFAWLLTEPGRQAINGLLAPVRRRGVVLLGAVPIATVSALLGLEEGFAAWSRWAYLLFFLYGFLIAGHEPTRAAMRRDSIVAALLGMVLFVAAGAAFVVAGGRSLDPLTAMASVAVIGRAVYGAAGWCWLVAIVGLLDRRQHPAREGGPRVPAEPGAVRPRRRWYAYLSEAILPLYILHQPIVVAVAFGVVRWEAPIPVKYLALVTASLVLTFTVYDQFVRRARVTRFLFGLRPQAVPNPAPAPTRSEPGTDRPFEDHRPRRLD
jgi:surface polysaccharide O-acyltransferase-like enzyme